MVNQEVLLGNWNEVQQKLRLRWGQLSEDDLRDFDGNVDELISLIQRKTGEPRESIEAFLSHCSATAGPGFTQMAEQARQYAQQARERAEQTSAMVTEQFRNRYSRAEEVLRDRPGQSLAAAFGAGIIAGLVVGLLVRPRSW